MIYLLIFGGFMVCLNHLRMLPGFYYPHFKKHYPKLPFYMYIWNILEVIASIIFVYYSFYKLLQ